MSIQVDKTQQNKTPIFAGVAVQKRDSSNSVSKFVDNRPEAIGQRKLKEAINNSPHVKQLKAFQEAADNSAPVKQLMAYKASFSTQAIQRKESFEEETQQGRFVPAGWG